MNGSGPTSSARVTITRAFVEHLPPARSDEVEVLALELARRGVPVVRFRAKELARRRLDLASDALVAGSVPSVESALRALGCEVPSGESYPAPLIPFLGRRVWPSTLGALERAFVEGEHLPVFVKPRARAKRFTGFVAMDASDFFRAGRTSRRAQVWCSEPVRFASEHRAFVLEGSVLDVRPYHGDASLRPDAAVVHEAVRAWSGAPVAYALDVGVLAESGATALVEANDAYAIGRYGLDPVLYTDLILARWRELALAREPGTVRRSDGFGP